MIHQVSSKSKCNFDNGVKNKSEVWLGANSFEDTFFLSISFLKFLKLFAPFLKLSTFCYLYDKEIDVLFSCKSLYIGEDKVKKHSGHFPFFSFN